MVILTSTLRSKSRLMINIARGAALGSWVFTAAAAYGADSLQDSKPKVASLVASPAVCVLADEQSHCNMQAAFLWEVPTTGDYCLWLESSETPLSCWQSTWSATLTWQIRSQQDSTYLLIDTRSQKEVARTTVRVIGELEQRIRARRRTGFWRVF